jgi:uncharacterized membrane protein
LSLDGADRDADADFGVSASARATPVTKNRQLATDNQGSKLGFGPAPRHPGRVAAARARATACNRRCCAAGTALRELARARPADYHGGLEVLSLHMIEQTPAVTPGEAVSMVILPHRSLTRTGLWWFLTVQSAAAGGFALLAAYAGNVFAPLFATVELVVVAWCLFRVWRWSGRTGEVITLWPDRLEIACIGAKTPPARFHPYWARLSLQPGNWRGAPRRLLVRSHGREIEIGAFLNDEERSALADRLSGLLAQARAARPARSLDETNSDAG